MALFEVTTSTILCKKHLLKSYEADLKQDIQYERTYMRTAQNLALNHVSRASERCNVSMDDCETDANLMGAQLETLFESKERFFHFCRATDMLSNEVKRVFILKKVYGLSQNNRLTIRDKRKHGRKACRQGLAKVLKYIGALEFTGLQEISKQKSSRANCRLCPINHDKNPPKTPLHLLIWPVFGLAESIGG